MFAYAQLPVKTEEKEIIFEVYYVYQVNDTIIAFVKGAMGLGVQKGVSATAYQAYQKAKDKKEEDREFKTIGSGRVVKADSLVSCLIKLNRTSETLQKGDMIGLKVKVPALAYRSIFSELVFNKILLANFNKNNFYTLNNFLFDDSKEKEDSLYGIMKADLKESYEFLKTFDNLPENVTSKMKTGRFPGKTVLEAMRDAEKKDIESFLLFVKDYPAKYMSQVYKLNETFATWVINDAPLSPTEIKNNLFPVYKNKARFLQLLPEYRQRIIKDGHCRTFLSTVEKLLASKKYEEAHAFNDFVKTVAYAVNDTTGKSLFWLYEAEINHNQGKYAAAVPLCDSAIKYALLAKEREYELAGLSKKIFCLYKSSQFVPAKKLLLDFENKLPGYRSAISAEVYNKNWQKRYEYEGALYYNEGNYGQALKSYAQLIELNKGINSYESLKKNAEYFSFIGRVNNDQGKPSNALDSFTRAAYIYKINHDTLEWARAQNDIAYSYYKLANYSQSMVYADSAIQKLVILGDNNNAGYSNSLKGSCYWELGKYDSAVMAHMESIELRKKADNLSGQAHSWKSIGELYLLSGQKNLALPAYDSAAYYYRLLKDSSGLAGIYNKKGNVFYNDENYKIAAEFFEKAYGINSKSTVEALYNLGNAWNSIDTIKSRNYFTACIRLSDSTKNTGYQFDASWALASLAYRTNNIKAGDQLYQSCLLLSKQLNTAQSFADCLALRGWSFKTQSQLDSALYYYNSAMSVYDSTSQTGVINQLNNIADVYITMGNFINAKQAYIKAIKLAEAANNNIALGSTLEATSFLYALTGEFEEGLKNSDSALAIFNRSGNMLRLANTWLSRGTLYKSMGEYNKSIHAFLKADSIYVEQQATEYRSVVSGNIGVTYFTQYDYANALKYHRLSLAQLKKEVVNESYLLAKGNIGEDLFYLKKYNEAEKELLEVYPVTKEKKMYRVASGIALSLGKLYYETKQTDRAIDYFVYAAEYANSSGEKEKAIEALTFLGKINNDKGKSEKAIEDFRKAVSIVSAYKIALGWEPFYQLGLLFYTQNQHDSAIRYFKKAVELLDKNSENLYGGEEAKKIFNNDPQKSERDRADLRDR